MSTPTDFTQFPKMARLSRECVITEKIDGTNGCILITNDVPHAEAMAAGALCYREDGMALWAGSRSRWLSLSTDNFGFARWAADNFLDLLHLGPGRHFGEWWGSGIQRGYGLKNGRKHFSLFNVLRWVKNGCAPGRIATADPRVEKYQQELPPCVGLVPELYRGTFSTVASDDCLTILRMCGSRAAPGYPDPEGIVVFHIAGNVGFKKTLVKDEEYKGKAK